MKTGDSLITSAMIDTSELPELPTEERPDLPHWDAQDELTEEIIPGVIHSRHSATEDLD